MSKVDSIEVKLVVFKKIFFLV